MYVYIHIYIYICMCTCICININMCVYIYIYICIYLYTARPPAPRATDRRAPWETTRRLRAELYIYIYIHTYVYSPRRSEPNVDHGRFSAAAPLGCGPRPERCVGRAPLTHETSES